jgi:hypothetical protein
MALKYDELMATSVVDLPFSYGDTESMLYAISIGMGRDAVNPDELPYVFEQGRPMRTVPAMASVLVPDMSPPDLGWDFSQVLHIEQRLELYRPLPVAADLLINKRIAAAYDHGPKRGALVLYEAEARRVGYPVPILHGLCTYGVACHAILKTICGYDYTLITGFDARFSAPVLPGDTITTDMWQDGNIVSFQCSVKERDIVVLKNGRCTLAA